MTKRFAYGRNMDVEPSFAVIGHLIGVPARANMLSALMDGRALTATELAFHAGVTPQTASSHLAKLTDAKMVVVEQQGRHRYYRLANSAVADALEPLSGLVAHRPLPQRHPTKELKRLRDSRLCYDHLAGRLGVSLADALIGREAIVAEGRDFIVTEAGNALLSDLEVDVAAVRAKRRVFARQCLDWSERRPHLGGALGAALAEQFLKRRWISRERQGRRVWVTKIGKPKIAEILPEMDLEALAA